MGSRTLVLLALLAFGLLGSLWWFFSESSVGPAPILDAAQLDPAGSLASPLDPIHGADGSSGSEADKIEARRDITQAPSEAVVQESLLRGWVISDALETPLAGADVTISYRLHGEYSNLDLSHSRSSRPVAKVATDSAGRFEVAVPEAIPLDVEVSKRAYARARRNHVFAGDEVLLRLAPAAILEGSLKRSADGSAIEGALVRGWNSNRVEQFLVRTNPGGMFLIDDLQAGALTVAIAPKAVASPPWKKIELRAGERTRLDLLLDTGVKVHGTVSDTRGRPIPGAEIGEGWTFRKSVITDALGSYELFGFGGPGVYDIHVRAPGFGSDQHEYPSDAMPSEDTRLDFVLAPARSATGRVLDSKQAPLGGVYAAGVASQFIDDTQHTDWESSLTGADGRFFLMSLDAKLGHQLFLRKEGFGTRVYDFPADESRHDQIDLGDFVLLPGVQVAGTLRTLRGTPIPDYTVKLRGANGDINRLRPDTEATNATWYTTVRESRTDSQGRFQFADVAAGEFEVTAAVRGNRDSAASVAVQVPGSGRVEDLELILDLGTPISGVVLKPDGSPALGVFVQVVAENQEAGANAVSGAGGRFELLGISEETGDCQLVTTLSSYNWGNPNARLAPSLPVAARAGDSDRILTLREPAVLTGKVVDAAGQPVAGILVTAFRSGITPVPGAELATTRTDDSGEFSIDLAKGDVVDLETGTLQHDGESIGFARIGDVPLRLESIASNTNGVVLQLLD